MKGWPLFSIYAQRASPCLVKGDQTHAWAPRARYTAEGVYQISEEKQPACGIGIVGSTSNGSPMWPLVRCQQYHDSGLGPEVVSLVMVDLACLGRWSYHASQPRVTSHGHVSPAKKGFVLFCGHVSSRRAHWVCNLGERMAVSLLWLPWEAWRPDRDRL